MTTSENSSHEMDKIRKLEEELNRLAESVENYRAAVQSSSDAIVLLDPARNVVTCNPAFLAIFGYTQDEITGKSIRLIHLSDDSFRSFGALR